MAPPPSMSPSPDPKLPAPTPLQPNLHNPLPLSATQEAQVREIYHRNVRRLCDPEIKSFARCAVGRTVTATWMCRRERLAMNGCMVKHAVPIEEDKAREEWFAGRDERRRKKEEEAVRVEERRVEVIRLIRMQEEKERREEELKMAQAQGMTAAAEGEKKSGGWWR